VSFPDLAGCPPSRSRRTGVDEYGDASLGCPHPHGVIQGWAARRHRGDRCHRPGTSSLTDDAWSNPMGQTPNISQWALPAIAVMLLAYGAVSGPTTGQPPLHAVASGASNELKSLPRPEPMHHTARRLGRSPVRCRRQAPGRSHADVLSCGLVVRPSGYVLEDSPRLARCGGDHPLRAVTVTRPRRVGPGVGSRITETRGDSMRSGAALDAQLARRDGRSIVRPV
jgi:hypothetical protein